MTFLFGKVTFLRVQSATMRDLEEDDSVESLKAKNQKVSKSQKKDKKIHVVPGV